jgi:hypothetical protein
MLFFCYFCVKQNIPLSKTKNMTRKELTADYKNIKFAMGVFQIKNLANGKILVESSPNLDKIWNRHCADLRFGSHRNKALQADWDAHGEPNFVFEILAEIDHKLTDDVAQQQKNRHELKVLEKMYIDELQPFGENGYH